MALNKNKGKLYACYYNLPSLKDSLGGIAEFDLNTFNELRRWKLDASSITLSTTGDTLFFFKDNSISLLKLNGVNPQPQPFIENPDKNETWYSLSYSAYGNTLWVGDAKNFQINGSLLIYDINVPGTIKYQFQTGINPNKILFF